MPIVRIDIQAGKSTAYKRAILHGVRRAITGALGVSDERVMQRIIETPGDDIDPGSARSDALTIIEISMLAGRGAEIKDRLYEEILRELRYSPGIVARDIMVYVYDPPAECFCIGSQAAEATENPEAIENPEDAVQDEETAEGDGPEGAGGPAGGEGPSDDAPESDTDAQAQGDAEATGAPGASDAVPPGDEAS